MKKAVILAAAALVLLLGGLWWLNQPLQMEHPSAQLLAATEGLDESVIEASLDAVGRTLSVQHTLRLKNRTGQALDAAVLRTWPNAFQSLETTPCSDQDYPGGFSTGALTMAHAQVDGQTALHRYLDEGKTLLSIPVSGGWQPDAWVEITLRYTVTPPRAAYRFGVWDGVWAFGNAFAVPAVWEDGAFRADEYVSVGDPFVSDCMNYDVTVTVPGGYRCAASGYAEADGSAYHFVSPAVRDFALVISDRFETAQAKQDGVLITAFGLNQAQAKDMLRYARKALKIYSERYGAYPYQSYSVAAVPFAHEGMEYPQLSMIGAALTERRLEYAIAHETAHQWWYAAVGSDGWDQPWQDEALCEFSLLEYAEAVYGAGERSDLEYSRAESAMRVTVPSGVAAGSPLGDFADMEEYVLLAYHRGLACLCAMDRTIPGGLDGFLRDYYQAYAFRRATRTDFEQLLTQSTGEDLIPLMRDYLDTHILN